MDQAFQTLAACRRSAFFFVERRCDPALLLGKQLNAARAAARFCSASAPRTWPDWTHETLLATWTAVTEERLHPK
jgi:hypothetical protein